jgi:hypothetical protein
MEIYGTKHITSKATGAKVTFTLEGHFSRTWFPYKVKSTQGTYAEFRTLPEARKAFEAATKQVSGKEA